MSSFSPSPLLESARKLADAGAWTELETALEPHALDPRPEPEIALLYVESLIRRGEERKALSFLDTLCRFLIDADEQSAYRRALNMKGAAHWSLGELADASTAYGLAVDLAQEAGDLLALAKATNNLGALANVRGEFEDALWHYRLALPTLERLGHRVRLAEAHHNMAHSYRDLARLDDADEHETRAMELAREGDASRVVAMSMVGRAEIALLRGDPLLAETTASLAAVEFARLGEAFNEADAHRVAGASRTELASYEAALQSFDRALELSSARGHTLNEAEALRDRAAMYLRQGQRSLARDDIQRASDLFDQLGASAESARLRRLLD